MEPAPLKDDFFSGVKSIIQSKPWTQWYTKLAKMPALDAPGNSTLFLRGDDTWQIPGGFVPGAHANSHAANGSDAVTLAQSQITDLVADLANKAEISTTITGTGLLAGGGGSLAANRTFDLLNTDIDHDALTNFVANEHINHTAVSMIAGTGLSGGGDISANRTINLDHLGIEDLSDPAADRVFFWDDSETKTDWLTVGTGLQISTTTLSTNDGAIDHDALLNFVANEHIDWTNASDDLDTSGFIDSGNYFKINGINIISIDGTNNLILGPGSDEGTTENSILIGPSVCGDGTLTGDWNVFVGFESGYYATSANSNLCFGTRTGYGITTSWSNSLLGTNAGLFLIGGNSNIGVGYAAIQGATWYSAIGNVVIGNYALVNITTDNDYNTIAGYYAGQYLRGDENVAIGAYSSGGGSNYSADGRVTIGYAAGQNDTNSDVLYIANSNTATPLIYGEFDNNYLKINDNLEVVGYLKVDTDTLAVNLPSYTDKVGIKTATPAETLDVNGSARFGDGTNYTAIESDGDLKFIGTAGMCYAGISAVGNSTETTISSAGVKYQVTIFDTNDPNNNATPDHTNDHITVTIAGDYFIAVSATVNSVAGAGSRFEMEVMKNNGATAVGALHVDRNIDGGGSKAGSVSMSGIATLSASDTVEVWIENETNTQNYIVEDITLSLIQIGG